MKPNVCWYGKAVNVDSIELIYDVGTTYALKKEMSVLKLKCHKPEVDMRNKYLISSKYAAGTKLFRHILLQPKPKKTINGVLWFQAQTLLMKTSLVS